MILKNNEDNSWKYLAKGFIHSFAVDLDACLQYWSLLASPGFKLLSGYSQANKHAVGFDVKLGRKKKKVLKANSWYVISLIFNRSVTWRN